MIDEVCSEWTLLLVSNATQSGTGIQARKEPDPRCLPPKYPRVEVEWAYRQMPSELVEGDGWGNWSEVVRAISSAIAKSQADTDGPAFALCRLEALGKNIAGWDEAMEDSTEPSPASSGPTLRPLNGLALWSAGLTAGAWIGYGLCVLFLLSGSSTGQHVTGFFLAGGLLLSSAAGVAGVVTGHIARSQLRSSADEGRSQATFGIVGGYLFLAVLVISAPINLFALAYTQCNLQLGGDCN